MSKRTVARALLRREELRLRHMAADGQLTAAHRGYRAPGRKLAPRDAYDAMECQHFKLNMRGLRKDRALQARAMGEDPSPTAPFWRRAHAALERLSSRDRRAAERVLWAEATQGDPERHYPAARLSRAQRRAIRSWERAHDAQRFMDIDERMLRNAI